MLAHEMTGMRVPANQSLCYLEEALVRAGYERRQKSKTT
jgi:hypothetical protein